MDTDWFPLDFFVKFLESDIKLTANGDENELQIRSETLFAKQIKGVYKICFKFGSSEFAINRISILHQVYFRGVSIKMTFDGSNKVIIRYAGFEIKHKQVELSLNEYYKKALEISGAKDVHVRYLTSIEEDKEYCELKIMWV